MATLTQKQKDQEIELITELDSDVKSIIERMKSLPDSNSRLQIKARLPIISSLFQSDLERLNAIEPTAEELKK